MSSSRKRQNQPPIKQEAGVVLKSTPESNSPGRLSSFKLPRDLTLGGQSSRKASKKVYTPNLNAVRVKSQDAPSSQDAPRGRGRGRGRGNRDHNERGRGRGRQNINLIQSESIFSEGSAAAFRRSSSVSSSLRDEPASAMQKPTLNLKTELKIDKDEEKEQLKYLLGDFFEAKDESIISKESIPTVLPISDRKVIFKIKEEVAKGFQPLTKKRIKQEKREENEVFIKSEVEDYCAEGESIPELGLNFDCDVKVKQEFEGDFTPNFAGLLSQYQSSIFLLQLPDTLPGQGPDTVSEKSSAKENEEQNTSIEQNAGHCILNQLDEGRIGKIIMYKSGKTELVLGDTIFDLGIGTKSTFLEEVMSLDVNSAQRSGNMINLGQIQAKLIASPDWNIMTCKQT